VTTTVARRLGLWTVVMVGALGLARGVVALPEHCSPPSTTTLEAASTAAVGWFAANQHPDGTWRYRYDATTDSDLGGYNWIRHAGVLLSLEQAAAAGFAGAADVADRGWEAIGANLVEVPTGTAFDNAGSLSTGGAALLGAALGERRLRTGEGDRDELLEGLARLVAAQVRPDGSVPNRIDPATGVAPDGGYSPFATGQALFFLARMDRLFPGEGWDEPVARITRYLAHERALREGYVPDVSDHWAAYGLAEMVAGGHPLSPDARAFARKQMGLAAIEVRYEAQRTNGGLDRWLRGRRTLGAGLGTIGESLGGWSRIAAADEGFAGQRGWLDERLGCLADLVVDRQATADDATAPGAEVAVAGAWFQFGITQMDDQQHSLSALLAARAALERREVDPAPRRLPVPESWLLAALAVAAAWNPPRVGRAGDRRGVAVGGGLGLGLVVLLAIAGGPLLRALDVSAPTGVIAAGAVAAIGGAVTVVSGARRTRALPRLGSGTVVPVLVPVIARPELVMLGLALGAGGQGWAAVAAATVALGISVALARPDSAPGPSELVTDWAARLVGAIALATAIALIVDGVYAV
jgi:hypothetical protein